MSEKRLDYPLCPHCSWPIVASAVQPGVLRCPNDGCAGWNLQHVPSGYEIALSDLTDPPPWGQSEAAKARIILNRRDPLEI